MRDRGPFSDHHSTQTVSKKENGLPIPIPIPFLVCVCVYVCVCGRPASLPWEVHRPDQVVKPGRGLQGGFQVVSLLGPHSLTQYTTCYTPYNNKEEMKKRPGGQPRP